MLSSATGTPLHSTPICYYCTTHSAHVPPHILLFLSGSAYHIILYIHFSFNFNLKIITIVIFVIFVIVIVVFIIVAMVMVMIVQISRTGGCHHRNQYWICWSM